MAGTTYARVIACVCNSGVLRIRGPLLRTVGHPRLPRDLAVGLPQRDARAGAQVEAAEDVCVEHWQAAQPFVLYPLLDVRQAALLIAEDKHDVFLGRYRRKVDVQQRLGAILGEEQTLALRAVLQEVVPVLVYCRVDALPVIKAGAPYLRWVIEGRATSS